MTQIGWDCLFVPSKPTWLVGQARKMAEWVQTRALPLWTTAGLDEHGSFHESLSPRGEPVTAIRRARVQPRQVYSLCLAGSLGWKGPWREIGQRAMRRFEAAHRRDEFGYRTLLGPDGKSIDDRALLYDLAFALMAYAGLGDSEAGERLQVALGRAAHPGGGFVDPRGGVFLANTLMHLLEACLVWEERDKTGAWRHQADALADIAIGRMVTPRHVIHEVYDLNWTPHVSPRDIEPGHQFEWSFLLALWAARRSNREALDTAARIFDAAERGVDRVRQVAVDQVDESMRPLRATARLWPQTERLKAALFMSTLGLQGATQYTTAAETSVESLWRYLEPSGLWHDVMNSDGSMQPGDAPASSFYHVMAAFEQLSLASQRVGGVSPALG